MFTERHQHQHQLPCFHYEHIQAVNMHPSCCCKDTDAVGLACSGVSQVVLAIMLVLSLDWHSLD